MDKHRERLEIYLRRWLEAYHTDIIPDIDTSKHDASIVTRVAGKTGRHIINCILKDLPEIFNDDDNQ